jgi:tRNA nucleotidyltransferase (CCA-adding enzyme)
MAILILGASHQYETIVDDDLYPILSRNRWTFKRSSRKHGGHVYGRRCVRRDGKKVTLMLSHEVLRLRKRKRPSPLHTADHRNRNTLDDRGKNLRWATKSQQSANQTRWKDRTG